MANIGAALLGLAGGYNQYQDDVQDRQYELSRRAALLKSADTSQQLNDLSLAEKKQQFQDATASAQALLDASQPLQSTAPSQMAPPQGVQPPVVPQGYPQPSTPSQAGPTPINTSGGWNSINQQGKSQQASADALAIQQLQGELKNMQSIAANDPNPVKRDAASDAVDSLRKEIANRATTAAQAAAAKADSTVQAPAQQIVDTVPALMSTGADVPNAPAADAYAQQSKRYQQAYQQTLSNPSLDPGTRARVSAMFLQQSQAAQEKSLKFQKEALSTQKEKVEAIGTAMGSLDANSTQAQYDVVKKLSPDIYADSAARLGLTGDINQDRDKVAALAVQGTTANQRQRNMLEAQNIDVKRQTLDLSRDRLNLKTPPPMAQAQPGNTPSSTTPAAPVPPEQDPTSAAFMPQDKGGVSGLAIKQAAALLNNGDTSQTTGLPRDGKAKAAIISEAARQNQLAGIDSDNALVNIQQGKALNKANQQLGAREGNTASAVVEANKFADIALAASDKVPRGDVVPLTRFIQSGQKNFSDPNLAAMNFANNSLANAYVSAVTRGTGTLEDRQIARQSLDQAQGPEAYKAVVNQMRIETQAALSSPHTAMENLRQSFLTRNKTGASPSPDSSAAFGGSKTVDFGSLR